MYPLSFATRHRPRGPAPSPTQVQRVAVDAISTLKEAGVDACFVGGMACKLFGNPRQPNDLDILCLTSDWGQESLKRRLVALNPHFYLVPSRDPFATYKVLWYRIVDTDSCVKVDLLFPGILDIPKVPLASIDRSNNARLPCAPLSVVLLLKLQAWKHHGESSVARFRMKQPMDARDIDALLPIARRLRILPRREHFLPASFISQAESRVDEYVTRFPGSKDEWKALGFTIIEKQPIRPRIIPTRFSYSRDTYAYAQLRSR